MEGLLITFGRLSGVGEREVLHAGEPHTNLFFRHRSSRDPASSECTVRLNTHTLPLHCLQRTPDFIPLFFK